MKKFTLVLFTLLTLLPLGSWAESITIEGVTYDYSGTTATVTSIENTKTEAVIPAQINVGTTEEPQKINITTIGATAFSGCVNLKTLTIGENVTTIPADVFKDCKKLQTLTINNSNFLQTLSINFTQSAVDPSLVINCNGVAYYHMGTWSDSNQYFAVGNGSNGSGFDAASANPETLAILNTVCNINVTTISNRAFYRVANGRNLSLPINVTKISDVSFLGNHLKTITVANDNKDFKSTDGVLFSKDGKKLISYPLVKGATYTVPDGVTTIGANAFNEHYTLSSVTIPKTVKTIEQSAFQYAGKNLSEGASLTINILPQSELKTIKPSVFQESGVNTINLPSGLETIGNSAFRQCYRLAKIALPSTLTSIGANAFNQCMNLITVVWTGPYINLTIGGSAFYNCRLQSSITLPEGVTTIGNNAFNRSNEFTGSSLENIYLPASADFSPNIVNSHVRLFRKVNMDVKGKGTWTTYYSNINLGLPNGWKAYTVTGVDGNTVNLTPLNYIHQQKAVVLELGDWPDGDYFEMPNNATIDLDKNVQFKPELFIGTSKPINNFSSLEGDKYVLTIDGNFVKSNQGTLPAFRCYIKQATNLNTTLYVNDGKANTFIFQEEGTQIDTSKKTLGTITLSDPSAGKITLSVTPTDGYYIHQGDITVKKNVSASSGRAQLVNSTVSLTHASGNDPSAAQTYTFDAADGFSYEVTADFHKCKSLSNTNIEKAVTLSKTSYEYDGTEHKPTISTITYGGTAIENSNYSLEYIDNIKAGSGIVRITGKGEFTGTYDAKFDINRRSINHTNISISAIENVDYNGTAHEPAVTIKDNVTIGSQTVNIITTGEFTLSYKDNINAGTGKVTIKAKDLNYTGQRDVTFTINPKTLTNGNITVSIPDQSYTGSQLTPPVTVKDGETVIPNSNYTVEYGDNKVVGDDAGTVYIKFGNNYSYSNDKYEAHFNIKDGVLERKLNVSFDDEWASFFWYENLKLPESGLEAYIVTGHETNSPTLILQKVNYIPKETGVLLKRTSDASTEYVCHTFTQDETTGLDNIPVSAKSLLKGTLETTKISRNYFVLYKDKFIQSTEGLLPANRCYLDYGNDNIGDVKKVSIDKKVAGVTILGDDGKESNKVGNVIVEDGSITVIPREGYYASIDEITVIRNIPASAGRAPAVDGGKVVVTPSEGNSDPRQSTTYTYEEESGYQYQIIVQFKEPRDLTKIGTNITLASNNFTYNGEGKEPKITSVTVDNGKLLLKEDVDYTVSYADNIEAGGSAKAMITGKGKYTNETWKTFNIGRRNFNNVTVKVSNQVYTGSPIKPIPEVIDIPDPENSSVNIIKSADYVLEYKNNVNVGTATVLVNADGEGARKSFTGNKSATFQILPKDLTAEGNEPTISGIEKKVYDGNPKELTLLIKDGVLTLDEGKDFDVEYIDNVEVGTAVATIKFKGNYKGEIQKEFEIYFVSTPKDITINFEGDNEWTTYYSSVNLGVPEGLKVYAVTGVKADKTVSLDTKEITFIPKNIGVLIQRTDKTKKEFTGMTMQSETKLEDVTPDEAHFLGTLAGIEDFTKIEGMKYVLKNDQFVQAVDGTLQANRCYILLTEKEAENVNVVDGDKDDIIVEQEGEANARAGEVLVSSVDGEGYKTIQVTPANVLYVTKNEITVLRYTGANGAFSRRVPGVNSNPVEVVPVDPTADPSQMTKYKFKYDSQYKYQIIVNFQKRINLSDKANNPEVTLKDDENLVYDGKEKKPTVESVTCNGMAVDPSNYTVSYENNVNSGKPRVIITGKRRLMGSTHAEFSIGKRDFSNVTIGSIADQEYTGSAIEPELDIKDMIGSVNILKSTDYSVTYSNNVAIGTATISIIPKGGNYEGSGRSITFKIVEASGIEKISVEELEEGQWFTLSGHPLVNKPIQKGVYIFRDKNRKAMKIRIK